MNITHDNNNILPTLFACGMNGLVTETVPSLAYKNAPRGISWLVVVCARDLSPARFDARCNRFFGRNDKKMRKGLVESVSTFVGYRWSPTACIATSEVAD